MCLNEVDANELKNSGLSLENAQISVSIIVPVYNVEKYLRRCLDSLVAQTLEDIEIILVNDCSPDHSWDIMQEYKENYPDKIILINSLENRRQGGARNLGIRIARGEYIGFVDSDDWIEYDMYEKLYRTSQQGDFDVVACNYDCTDGVNAIAYTSLNPDWSGDLVTLRKSLIIKPAPVWVKIYKKTLLFEYGLFFPEHRIYEDNFWSPLVFLYVRSVAIVNEVLYHYFINPTSTMHLKDEESFFDRLDTMLMFWNVCHERGFYDIYKEEIDYVFTQLYFINSMYGCLNAFKKVRFDKLIEMRSTLLRFVPDFRSNRYYLMMNPLWRRFYVNVCIFSPRLYILLKRIVRKIRV